METDDAGVLRGLPRSRPGVRSGKRAAPAPRPARPRPAKPPQPPADPVGDAVKTVAGAAGAGLRLADAVTREVLRRLPRP
jgi:hypothetical protein